MRNGVDEQFDNLQPGDSLEFRSELDTWIVIAAFNCSEGPYHWVEYELEIRGGDTRAFLTVEFDDDEWVISFFDRQVQPEEINYIRGQEFPEELNFEGDAYPLSESGKMRVGKVGSTILWNGEYADYARDGGDIVSIEAYPDPTNTPRETELEIWAGRDIAPRSIVIYRAETEIPRPALLPTSPTQQTSSSRAHEVVRQTTAPIERRYNTFTDSAQRKLLVGIGIAASTIFVIVLLILFA